MEAPIVELLVPVLQSHKFRKYSLKNPKVLLFSLFTSYLIIYMCMYMSLYLAEQTQSFASGTNYISIWDIKDTYKVKVLSAKNINVPENHKVYSYMLLVHVIIYSNIYGYGVLLS